MHSSRASIVRHTVRLYRWSVIAYLSANLAQKMRLQNATNSMTVRQTWTVSIDSWAVAVYRQSNARGITYYHDLRTVQGR